jgi:8-oxo-dGTP diphosphatase
MVDLDLKRGVDFIGVTVPFVVHDGHGSFVMHRRSAKCRDEQGRWDIGSGAMEFGESFEQAVRREVLEEYGAEATEVVELGLYNIIRANKGAKTHWIAISHALKVDPAKVKNCDPEKIEDLGWFRVDKLPSPLHSQVMKSLNLAKKAGII